MIVCIDNGHGVNTPGKQSPNGVIKEWKYTRDIAKAISDKLISKGYKTFIVTPEDEDISLAERVKRVNDVAKQNDDAILISVHLNAAGDGVKYSTASGWECYTTPGVTKSDNLANCLYDSFKKEFPNQKMRTDQSDNDQDKEANFYIIKNTSCPAVLTENFFMDGWNDYNLLLKSDAIDKIANAHVEAIINYIKTN